KGYHSREALRTIAEAGIRTYISEPERGRQRWKDQVPEQTAVYENRRRIRGERGKRLQSQRCEKLERVNAHLYETGRMRRVHLRGHSNILKRLLIHVGSLNLGLLMRSLFAYGTPRGLQGRRMGPLLVAQLFVLRLVCSISNQVEEFRRADLTPGKRETPFYRSRLCSRVAVRR